MVALVLLGSPQAHDPQSRSHGSFARSEDRAREQHLDMWPDALLENSGTKGFSRCSILVGRVCIIASPVRLTMSIPYLLVTPNG